MFIIPIIDYFKLIIIAQIIHEFIIKMSRDSKIVTNLNYFI